MASATPCAWTRTARTKTAYAIDSFPDYCLIDRAGNLRVVDLVNGELERVVKVLLKEPVPAADIHPALSVAAARALARDKRMLAVWGTAQERAPMERTLKGLGQLVRYEYEVVPLERGEHASLAETHEAGSSGVLALALDANGAPLGRYRGATDDPQALRSFLEAQQVPQKKRRGSLRGRPRARHA